MTTIGACFIIYGIIELILLFSLGLLHVFDVSDPSSTPEEKHDAAINIFYMVIWPIVIVLIIITSIVNTIRFVPLLFKALFNKN
jgi:hypothetical protein